MFEGLTDVGDFKTNAFCDLALLAIGSRPTVAAL